MEQKKVTLKDLSEKMGVSLSTIHKALYGKPGISKKVRAEILSTAEEMGYRTNFIASSLKRKPVRLAFVMPWPHLGPNRYYYLDLWRGMRSFKEEAAQFNVEFSEFGFDGGMENLPQKLKEILEYDSDSLSGLITQGIETSEFADLISQFSKKKIPVVYIASDASKTERLCCVSNQDVMAGSLGAELISNFIDHGKVLVAAGDAKIASHYRNAWGFESYLTQSASPLKAELIYNSTDTDQLYQQLLHRLSCDPEIKALYACTARNTVTLCQAAIHLGLEGRIKIVGSDLFLESREMLLNGVLQAIIYKNPYKIGVLGCQSLFNYVAKNQMPQTSTQLVEPTVVLKSNARCYDSGDYSEDKLSVF